MLERVFSGGQTGGDIAGLRAAKKCGIPTGGFAAKGWLMENVNGRGNVSAPWLADDFGLVECQEGNTVAERYVARRRANVAASDGTVLFFKDWTPGTKGVLADLGELRKPSAIVCAGQEGADTLGIWNPDAAYLLEYAWVIGYLAPEGVNAWLHEFKIRTLNVAGPRASKAPKLETFAERFLTEAFRIHLEGNI